jgi:hypothetical protein
MIGVAQSRPITLAPAFIDDSMPAPFKQNSVLSELQWWCQWRMVAIA